VDFRETLRIDNTTIVDLSSYPGEKGTNHVLTLKAPLTISVARVLKNHDIFFDINDLPRDFSGRITDKKIIKSCSVLIPRLNGSREPLLPKLVWKFNCGFEKDRGPTVVFRLHFDGYRTTLGDLLEETGTSAFHLTIEALQPSLFDETEGSDEDGPDGGTQVDMSEPEPEPEIQMTIADIEAAEKPIEPAHTFPSLRSMAGGTTGDLRKTRKPRGREPQKPVSTQDWNRLEKELGKVQ
jgi:hypothetical protein